VRLGEISQSKQKQPTNQSLTDNYRNAKSQYAGARGLPELKTFVESQRKVGRETRASDSDLCSNPRRTRLTSCPPLFRPRAAADGGDDGLGRAAVAAEIRRRTFDASHLAVTHARRSHAIKTTLQF